METVSIWLPILMCFGYIFMFYSSGIIFLDFFKFKIKNNFIAIAIGFFMYFSFISVLTFPLQLLSVLPYIFFIYFSWALTLLYLVFCLVFTKYWFVANILNLSTVVFIVLLLIIFAANIIGNNYLSHQTFEESPHNDVLKFLYTNKRSPISFFDKQLLRDETGDTSLGFKPFQAWTTFQVSFILIFNVPENQYGDIIVPISLVLDTFLVSSIVICLIESFTKTSLKKIKIYEVISSMVLIFIFKILLFIFNLSLWSENTIFLYLIGYSTIWFLRYTNFENRERFNPMFIGFILGGYIAFSWESSYQVLFLIYSFLFVIQKKYRINFVKDIFKISIFPFINFLFYNIILQYYIPVFIFSGVLFLLILTGFLMKRNYSVTTKFETFIDQKNSFTILFLPVIFITLSVAISLGKNKSIISDIEYLNFIYLWISFIDNSAIKYWFTIISSLGILVSAFLWVFVRKKIKSNLFIDCLDSFLIIYLTFYNPIGIKFINIIYPEIIKTGGVIMLVLIFELSFAGIFEATYKIEEKKYKKQKNKVKVYKSVNWLQF